MNLIKLIAIFLLSMSIFINNVFASELTIRSSISESTKYNIKKIKKTKIQTNDGLVSAIIIETTATQKCIIPLNKIVSSIIGFNQGTCRSAKQLSEVEAERMYTQLFLNSIEPDITCDISNGETSGFRFVGSTTINGESTFTLRSMMFDSDIYSNGDFFTPEEEETPLDEVLDDIGSFLGNLFISYPG